MCHILKCRVWFANWPKCRVTKCNKLKKKNNTWTETKLKLPTWLHKIIPGINWSARTAILNRNTQNLTRLLQHTSPDNVEQAKPINPRRRWRRRRWIVVWYSRPLFTHSSSGKFIHVSPFTLKLKSHVRFISIWF